MRLTPFSWRPRKCYKKSVTKAWILALLAVTLGAGADDQQAALERKAKSAFDRAMLSAQPQLGRNHRVRPGPGGPAPGGLAG